MQARTDIHGSGMTYSSNGERRSEHRDNVIGNLWMIDNASSTVMRCRCVDASSQGMRLRVPLGYGISQGQQYELTSHLPGQSAPPGLGLMVSRRAVVVRAEVTPSDDEFNVEVGVRLAPSRTAVLAPIAHFDTANA
jgi:hypothetical protein